MTEAIWIVAEREPARINPVTFQLITKAKAIAQGKKVVVVLLEAPDQQFEQAISEYGPDEILLGQNAAYAQASDEVMAAALTTLAKEYQPNAVLFGATPLGRSIAPRVQAALQTGLTADCLDFFFEEDLLVQVKPSYGDNVMCEITCPDRRPQMASVRPNTFAAEKVAGTTPAITPVEVAQTTGPQGRVVDETVRVSHATGIASANKVLALGRGAATPADIASAREIASRLGASVGVSRPLTDLPDFTVEQQIGQSGTTIAPDFLLNLGVSGATQFIVGMTQAKLVVSVNRDAQAPIFAQSDYTFTGDAAAFITALKQRMN